MCVLLIASQGYFFVYGSVGECVLCFEIPMGAISMRIGIPKVAGRCFECHLGAFWGVDDTLRW